MEQRVLFRKGKQREFFNLVIQNLNCLSLRGLLQFGFDVPYSTLKCYYSEKRLISKSFFEDLCRISKIDVSQFRVKYLDGNWGQVRGGRKSRRK